MSHSHTTIKQLCSCVIAIVNNPMCVINNLNNFMNAVNNLYVFTHIITKINTQTKILNELGCPNYTSAGAFSFCSCLRILARPRAVFSSLATRGITPFCVMAERRAMHISMSPPALK